LIEIKLKESKIKPTHLTDYLRRNAQQTGDKPAIVFEGVSTSWRELWERVEAASWYVGSRLKSNRQQVVDILLPNSLDFVVAYLAVVHSGHIALLLDPAYKSLELDSIIEQIPPKFIITDKDYKNILSDEHQSSAVLIDEMTGPAGTDEFLRLPADEQIACLMFTSGTTGKPKVVPNTHSNHIWNIKVCSEVWDWTAADSLLIASPLSHMIGIVMGIPGALYHGNTLYIHRWFNEESTLKALASGKISFFSHASSAYVKLVQAPGEYDLSAVRLCVSGAAPLPPAVWREFKDRYGIEILETYGSSETGRIAGNRLNERILGSPGKPLPGVQLRISREGEVEVKSGGLFPGYYKNPQATKAALTDDGYWRTGDLGELKDGYVFLKGRLQERIRRFGYTISPRDVEWALHKHPDIRDVYVMGRQQENQPNDELIYFIVTNLSDDEIKQYCKANLLFAWRPDRIIHLNELPRTASGKAKIGKLKELAA
jgi:acyl-CoA synthetase (AMP-forming)/AMP-acid ligase II